MDTLSASLQPKSNAEIAQPYTEGVPAKTQQDTKYCVDLWRNSLNRATSTNMHLIHSSPLLSFFTMQTHSSQSDAL